MLVLLRRAASVREQNFGPLSKVVTPLVEVLPRVERSGPLDHLCVLLHFLLLDLGLFRLQRFTGLGVVDPGEELVGRVAQLVRPIID